MTRSIEEDDFDGEFGPIKVLPVGDPNNEIVGESRIKRSRSRSTSSNDEQKFKNIRHIKIRSFTGAMELDSSDSEDDLEVTKPISEPSSESNKHEPLLKSSEPDATKDITTSENDQISHIETIISANVLNKVKSKLLSQLNGDFVNLKDSSLHEKFKEVFRILESSIRDKEGHSALIIGPRSCGKTSIVNRALAELETKYHDQFMAISLNALVHTDDNVALREIARQLDVKLKARGEHLDFGSFEQKSINETFGNILSILQNSVESGPKEQRLSVIFIIDEFEKFTSNHKQTLLYNLLDLSQSSTTPICVIGLSTKVTTRELLEKRVSSRFSQRIIPITHESNIEAYWQNAKLALTLNTDTEDSEDFNDFVIHWNQYIENLFRSGKALNKLVARIFYTTKDYRHFNNACKFPISRLTLQHPFPDDVDFGFYTTHSIDNTIQCLMDSLSNIELLLVIAAARWIEKYELQAINFNLAYAEYKEMMKSFNLSTSSTSTDNRLTNSIRINQRIWSEKVLRNSWESLYKMGLLLDAGGITTNNEGHIISNTNLNKSLIIEDNRMVQLDVTLTEIATQVEDSVVYKRFTML
ncbi:Origin recognition complex subunit 4 [Spathaspora sp. JA1]|nr:Origin recognition complex subunit 4 [Spathaspora sp. JA1]